MQTTSYYVMVQHKPGHWIELLPRPRSRNAALSIAESAATSGNQVRVERHVYARNIVATLNKPGSRPVQPASLDTKGGD